jgi:hypothetical protein
MALDKPTMAVNNIQGLATRTTGQATAVKVLHDKAGSDIKTYLIALCDQLDLDFATKLDLANAILGEFPDGSILDIKLSDTAGQIKDRLSSHIPGTDPHTQYAKDLTITGTDLTAWADTQTRGGYFYVPSTVTTNVPAISFYSAFLDTPVAGVKRIIMSTFASPIKTYINIRGGSGWLGWTEQAAVPLTGTYTGDGTASRTITLGFRPRSVLVVPSFGISHANESRYDGGLALDGFPVQQTSDAGLKNILTVVATGFSTGQYSYVSGTTIRIGNNESGVLYHYKADR